MKTTQITLEDFGANETEVFTTSQASDTPQVTESDLEAIRLTAYENGYKSGWDDGIRSCEEEGKAVSEELSRNLKDMEFTYFEAREEISRVLRAFLTDLFTELFPTILPDSVFSLTNEAMRQSETALSGDLELILSIEDAPIVRSLLKVLNNDDVKLVEEPAMVSGQAKIRIHEKTTMIDVERLVSNIREHLLSDGTDERFMANG